MGKAKDEKTEKIAKLTTAAEAMRSPISISTTPCFRPSSRSARSSREGHPYDKKLKREPYEEQLQQLQLELIKLQAHAETAGERIVAVFEGRDTSGKGGCISRILERINPRHSRSVALSKPTEAERGQWYFQRYVAQLPTKGDMVLFDRSWYNRAGVERVMGFCTEEQTAELLSCDPVFESAARGRRHPLLQDPPDGRAQMQLMRFHERRHDPFKQWKVTDIDIVAVGKSRPFARRKRYAAPHASAKSPWTVCYSNDQRRAAARGQCA